MRISDWSSDVCSSDLPPLTINRADPVTVAIKGDPKVQFFFRDKGLQIGQVLFFGRVGMMVGELAVHFGEKQMMLTRRSEEHTSELQSLMRISYAVCCLNKKIQEL